MKHSKPYMKLFSEFFVFWTNTFLLMIWRMNNSVLGLGNDTIQLSDNQKKDFAM